MTVAGRCASFAAGLTWADVPADLVRKLRAHLLDTLAVACAGASTRETDILFSCHAASPGACGVIGRDARLPPADAALLNAFAARRQTFDDTLEAGPIHPGSSLWAASLAAAEHADAPLARALLGGLCGYELAIRLADLLGPAHYDAGYHGTGTCNAPASGLAAAVALGLDTPHIADAVSLAAGAASGTRQYQIDGSIAHSALNGARAAEAGMRSALYAAAGFGSPRGQLDGKWGLLGLLGGRSGGFDDLGAVWAFRRVGLKPYPTCRFTHGPVAAFDALRQLHHLAGDDVASIELRTFAQSISVSDRPAWTGRDEALLSHQFALAATLAEGPPELATLDRLAADERVRGLAAQVAVRHDPALEDRRPEDWPHLLRVHLRDGTELLAESWAPPGAADDPAIRFKAEGLLGPDRLATLEAMLDDPDKYMARDLMGQLRPC